MTVTLRHILSATTLLSVLVLLVTSWRKRKTDEHARMTLAYSASVAVALLLAAAVVVVIAVIPS